MRVDLSVQMTKAQAQSACKTDVSGTVYQAQHHAEASALPFCLQDSMEVPLPTHPSINTKLKLSAQC